MKKTITTCIAGILLSGIAQPGANAQSALVSYTVNTNDDSHAAAGARGVLPAQQGTVDALLAPATSATLGSGASPNNYPFGLTIFPTFSPFTPPTLASAIANNFYLGFTITPAAGTSLDLSDLDLTNFVIESTDGNPQLFQYDVLSSVGGFTDNASLDTVHYDTAGQIGDDIQLGSAFSNLTTATTFRIYISGDPSDGDGYQTTNINDGSLILLNGTSVPLGIPEPGTYALMGLGVVLLIGCYKRDRRLVSL